MPTIPNDLHESLTRYTHDGVPTGDFLRAVLANDLQGAIARGDIENLAILPAITRFVWNEVPANICGSYEAVRAHIDARGAARWEALKAEQDGRMFKSSLV